MDDVRRKTLKAIGGVTALGVISPGVLRRAVAAGPSSPKEVLDEKGQIVHQALPYTKLDADEVAERAYRNYYKGDCMYGVFASIVEALADKIGEPYISYPKTVTRYGAGGAMGWSTLCGAPNGAAMAIYLVSKEPVPLIDEVFGYYQATPLPDYTPKKAKFKIASSVSDSTLCHVSVTNWCKETGLKAFSPERAERCAHLVASVARKTVEVLNAQKAGKFNAAFPVPAEVQACRGCHDKGGELENTRGKMSCTSCHDDLGPNHPGDSV